MNPANPGAAGAPAAGGPAGQQQQQQQRPNMMKMVLTYMAINWVINNFFKSNAPSGSGPLSYRNIFDNDEPFVHIWVKLGIY